MEVKINAHSADQYFKKRDESPLYSPTQRHLRHLIHQNYSLLTCGGDSSLVREFSVWNDSIGAGASILVIQHAVNRFFISSQFLGGKKKHSALMMRESVCAVLRAIRGSGFELHFSDKVELNKQLFGHESIRAMVDRFEAPEDEICSLKRNMHFWVSKAKICAPKAKPPLIHFYTPERDNAMFQDFCRYSGIDQHQQEVWGLIDDPNFDKIGKLYGALGLLRKRAILLAREAEGGPILGCAFVNHGPLGTNTSMCENTIVLHFVPMEEDQLTRVSDWLLFTASPMYWNFPMNFIPVFAPESFGEENVRRNPYFDPNQGINTYNNFVAGALFSSKITDYLFEIMKLKIRNAPTNKRRKG